MIRSALRTAAAATLATALVVTAATPSLASTGEGVTPPPPRPSLLPQKTAAMWFF
ncbi:hypothetical protein [Microbacterium amylolyticum]|uniref:Uncharacterized protein n=1 Tax=Microbacterium amylolyticum TaxID=936337 RepID=A0ABS4ZG87_9MICO|nr:hypothetical protein [Microbacterium amylolyticum]MBP2436028.1 hypothetical protein [Microbacterium amylolyticum]